MRRGADARRRQESFSSCAWEHNGTQMLWNRSAYLWQERLVMAVDMSPHAPGGFLVATNQPLYRSAAICEGGWLVVIPTRS